MKKFPGFLFSLWVIFTHVHAATILIDPGHGGEDVGSKNVGGNRVHFEKDIGLELAKKIYWELKKKHTVYLTRSVDRTITLEHRSEMADKVNADLFISVHLNSSLKRESHGMETYYLDNHNDVAVKKIENVENPHLKGSDLVANQILIDLLVQRMAPSSKRLASSIHGVLKKKICPEFKMVDRGVRPGLFYVLALSKRPAVLLEAGFFSNPEEAKKLMNPDFQESYAKAVALGIDHYLQNHHHGKSNLAGI